MNVDIIGLIERVLSKDKSGNVEGKLIDLLEQLEERLDDVIPYKEHKPKKNIKVKTHMKEDLEKSLDRLIKRIGEYDYTNYDELADLIRFRVNQVVSQVDKMYSAQKLNSNERNDIISNLEALTTGKNSQFDHGSIKRLASKMKIKIMDYLEMRDEIS